MDINALYKILQFTSATIYDSISQNLCLVKLNLSTINMNDPTKTGRKIKQSENLINKSIAELRKVAVQLDEIKEIIQLKEKNR